MTKVLILFITLQSYAQKHPFLIVKENQYKALQDKANSNQQPFKTFKNVSVKRWDLPYADNNNAKFLDNIAVMVNYNIIAYLTDPVNKTRYKNRLIELIGTGKRQLQAIETNASHRVFVGGTTALFNQIIALDIIYPDLNNNQRKTAENNIGNSVNWYRDNGGSRAWRLSVDGINLLWALYRSNQKDIDFWKNRYDDYLFNKSMTKDGSWGQSPGYVYARMHGSRISKFGCIDVMQHMGVQNYYNDPRMKKLFQWAASFALTPSGSYSKFGDTINNEYQLNRGTSMHYANVYGPTIGGMFRWNNNRDGNILGPQSFQSTNYMILILRKLNQDKAIMPTSILKEQSGVALWDRTDSREALQGIVYSLKRNNPNEKQFGHTMEDVNSIDISAYGQHMITNAGGLYIGKNNKGSNYPGYTPVNDRWFLAKYQNTVLIGGRTTHNQRHGGGLTDGLVGGDIEFGTAAAGPAINNGSHLRTLHFIHPETNKSNGYFVVYDEVKPNKSSDRVDIQFQMNTKRNGTKTIKGNVEYEAPINGFIYDTFNAHDKTEKVSLFFTSNPKVNIVDSYKGIKRNIADRKTDNVRAEYKAKADGYVRATTVIFPQDSKHKKPGISKISNSNYDGAIVSHSNSFKDYYIGSSPSKTNTYSNISFKASTTFYRKESGTTTKFSSTNGTVFKDTEGVDYGYESKKIVSVVLENNSGRINAKSNTEVTFFRDKISGVKIDGKDAKVTATASNAITVNVPKGRHTITLITGGTPPVTTPPSGGTSQAPFGGTARAIPGTIEAEDFDTGGQGVAYNDVDAANRGSNVIRANEGVDLANSTNENNPIVGWTANGEWLEYTVNTTAGTYTMEARVATTSTGKSIVAKLDGKTLGTFNLPNTNGWDTFQTLSIPNVTISAGNNNILRLEFVGGGVNLNWVKFNVTQTAPPPAPDRVSANIVNGNYYIEAPNGGLKMTSPSGRIIDMVATSNSSAQWELIKTGNYFTIKNLRNNEFLEVPAAACERGAKNNPNLNLGTWNDVLGDHKKWNITKVGNDYFIEPLHCKKVIDRNNGKDIHLWPYQEGNANQNWKIVRVNTNNTPPAPATPAEVACSTNVSVSGLKVSKSGTTATLTFNNLTGVKTYEVRSFEKGTHTGGISGTKPFKWASGSSSPITINGLSANLDYTVVIRAICTAGGTTKVSTVETAGTSAKVNNELSNRFDVYPNPLINGELTIQLAESIFSTITIYDTLGKVVYQKNVEESIVKIQRDSISGRGLCFIKIQQGNKTYTKKLILAP